MTEEKFLTPTEVTTELEDKLNSVAKLAAEKHQAPLIDHPSEAPVWQIGPVQIALVKRDGQPSITVCRFFSEEEAFLAILPSSATEEAISGLVDDALTRETA